MSRQLDGYLTYRGLRGNQPTFVIMMPAILFGAVALQDAHAGNAKYAFILLYLGVISIGELVRRRYVERTPD